jgi:hypothetical protein
MEGIECSPVKVYIGNLPFTCTGGMLEDLGKQFGEVIGAKIVSNRTTRKPRGFGFVTFKEEQSASDCLKLNGSMYEGRPLTVRPAAARGTGSLKDEEDMEEDGPTALPVAPRTKNTISICKFDSMPGGCKFGNRCKFSHSMSSWTGSGAEETQVKSKGGPSTKKNKQKQTDKKEAGNKLPVPRCVVVVAEERLTFLNNKIATSGEPSPAQLGMFLKSVVNLLHAAIQDDRAKCDMFSIGWNYVSNSSLPSSSPPSIKQVVGWLKNPVFVPAPEVSVQEFAARSNTSEIATLLSEYGTHDPDWQEKTKEDKKA